MWKINSKCTSINLSQIIARILWALQQKKTSLNSTYYLEIGLETVVVLYSRKQHRHMQIYYDLWFWVHRGLMVIYRCSQRERPRVHMGNFVAA